jgi:hypothetical protein
LPHPNPNSNSSFHPNLNPRAKVRDKSCLALTLTLTLVLTPTLTRELRYATKVAWLEGWRWEDLEGMGAGAILEDVHWFGNGGKDDSEGFVVMEGRDGRTGQLGVWARRAYPETESEAWRSLSAGLPKGLVKLDRELAWLANRQCVQPTHTSWIYRSWIYRSLNCCGCSSRNIGEVVVAVSSLSFPTAAFAIRLGEATTSECRESQTLSVAKPIARMEVPVGFSPDEWMTDLLLAPSEGALVPISVLR